MRNQAHSRPQLHVAKLYLMDTSGSMNGVKLDQLKRVLVDLIASGQYYAQDLVSLWSFDAQCRKHVGFTPVRGIGQHWHDAVLSLRADGTTNMASALYTTIGAMAEARHFKKTIVLLSDGMPYPESRDQVLARLPAAQRYHIRINTVGFGEADALDIPLLRQLAAATGGTFTHARALAELSAALRAA